MPTLIAVAHDYICPWCWIGLLQIKALKEEFDVEFDYLSYELMPEELPWDPPTPPAPEPPQPENKPKTPSRLALAYAAQGIEPPTVKRPRRMRSHNALEATEYAKTEGKADAFVERLYRALWEEGREINNPDVLAELAEGLLDDVPAMLKAVETKQFDSQIVKFDDESYAKGVYNVPTYFIGGVRYAEEPLITIRKALREAGVPERPRVGV